jgi:hypothetical protein
MANRAPNWPAMSPCLPFDREAAPIALAATQNIDYSCQLQFLDSSDQLC